MREFEGLALAVHEGEVTDVVGFRAVELVEVYHNVVLLTILFKLRTVVAAKCSLQCGPHFGGIDA
ncbi:hypothetical protein D3C72_2558170 [compost metagenome]